MLTPGKVFDQNQGIPGPVKLTRKFNHDGVTDGAVENLPYPLSVDPYTHFRPFILYSPQT